MSRSAFVLTVFAIKDKTETQNIIGWGCASWHESSLSDMHGEARTGSKMLLHSAASIISKEAIHRLADQMTSELVWLLKSTL